MKKLLLLSIFSASIFVFISLSAGPVLATASWYNDDWHYRKAITVDNTSNASTLTDYQVKVSLSSANFDFTKAQADGDDIRFTDNNGTTLINYWVEAYDSSPQTATIYVQVPSL